MNRKERFLFFLLLIGSSVAFSQTDVSGVQLKKVRDFSQLIINGKPFIILGGELGNSIASNMEYLEPFFPKIKSMNLNTVLAPVYWEFLEPEENKFDEACASLVRFMEKQYELLRPFVDENKFKTISKNR